MLANYTTGDELLCDASVIAQFSQGKPNCLTDRNSFFLLFSEHFCCAASDILTDQIRHLILILYTNEFIIPSRRIFNIIRDCLFL